MKKPGKIFPVFSFYDGPITNKFPRAKVTIPAIYRGITSGHYQEPVKQLRATEDTDRKRQIKQGLDYVTFAGTFTSRHNKNLLKHSGYICIDLDHIEPGEMQKVKKVLLNDEMFDTELLFTSPSGTGLKWVIEVDLQKYPGYQLNFRGVSGYLKHTYPEYFNVETNILDETGKDVSRACFMSWDTEAFINPKYFSNGK